MLHVKFHAFSLLLKKIKILRSVNLFKRIKKNELKSLKDKKKLKLKLED